MSIDFVKYNGYREKKFALCTIIGTDGDKKIVKKISGAPESNALIEAIAKNYTLLKQQYEHVYTCPCTKNNDDSELVFEFIEGENFFSRLMYIAKTGNKKDFIDALFLYQSIIFDKHRIKPKQAFSVTPEFISIFGKYEGSFPFSYLEITNIDMIFSNLVIDKFENCTMVDYEWVFRFPMPIKYVISRSIGNFFNENKNKQPLPLKFEEALMIFDISGEEVAIFNKMEAHFQDNVQNRKLLIYNRFLKNNATFHGFIQQNNDLTKQNYALTQQNNELTQQRNTLPQQISDMYNSKTWKTETKVMRRKYKIKYYVYKLLLLCPFILGRRRAKFKDRKNHYKALLRSLKEH